VSEFRMPSLGADMDTGTVTQWLVHPGDTVHRGDIVAVVDTDKADVEVEVFEDGVIEELLVPEGTEVAVGSPLARIGAAPSSQPPAAPTAPSPAAEAPVPPKVGAPTTTVWHAPRPDLRASPVARRRAAKLGIDLATISGTGKAGGITRVDVERAASGLGPTAATPDTEPTERGVRRVSPRARRLAREHGVEPAVLVGTGPGGAVIGADVERAVPETAGASTPVARPRGLASRTSTARTAEKASGMRSAIARAMARSKREIPHYYLTTDIDFSRARAFLAERNETRPVTMRVLAAALLLKATALGVRDTPDLNGFWVDDAFRPSDAVHVGVAISLRGGGLVAPAIHHADTLSLDDLMSSLRDLVNRVRAGSLRASEMSDPTLTVTNLGEQGVQSVYGVIYPPQVALVGFGAITERPWAVEGMVGAHPIVTATLAADHRASDGARGARLLNVIDRLLQEPDQL
jgi:pyruvate dehydrogenase E2 component (dihydrolipoamide acetyltransferase)